MPLNSKTEFEIGLNAAIVSTSNKDPLILIMREEFLDEGEMSKKDVLPFGMFNPELHRTMDNGLRIWVKDRVGVELAYVEQLYTFGDRDRYSLFEFDNSHIVSVGYLALTRLEDEGKNFDYINKDDEGKKIIWKSWYDYFPWEDWRKGKPEILEKEIEPRLINWAKEMQFCSSNNNRGIGYEDRVRLWFGMGDIKWDEERVLERYELLYEAEMVYEAFYDAQQSMQKKLNDDNNHEANRKNYPIDKNKPFTNFGKVMAHDHRRILATSMGRLRGKLKYRPVIFELMADKFTLFELQKTIEAISGINLHKQNFRRLVLNEELIEEASGMQINTGGRPAKLFSFKRDIIRRRLEAGLRVGSSRR